MLLYGKKDYLPLNQNLQITGLDSFPDDWRDVL
jgi:hypothetical protein